MFWETFECEICKQAYPHNFKVENGKLYKLVDFEEIPYPIAPYKHWGGHFLVLESLPLEKNSSRSIHILSFTSGKSTYTMGRGYG